MCWLGVSEGEPVRFQCNISGLPAPNISWYKDEKPIKQSADFRFERDGDKYSLFMTRATKDFSGKYTVRAGNKNGAMESTADLLVGRVQENYNPSLLLKTLTVN